MGIDVGTKDGHVVGCLDGAHVGIDDGDEDGTIVG